MVTTPDGGYAENARDRLLTAALESFSAKGFHGTSTRDVARVANLSPAAVYVHFRSKEDLLYAISKAGHEYSLAIACAAVARATDPVEQLAALQHDFTLQHAEDNTQARVVNYELAALSPAHRTEIVAIRRAIESQFRQVLQAGVDSGQFDVDDVDMTARALISLGIDAARWFVTGGAWSAEDLAAHHTQIALRTVGIARRRSARRRQP